MVRRRGVRRRLVSGLLAAGGGVGRFVARRVFTKLAGRIAKKAAVPAAAATGALLVGSGAYALRQRNATKGVKRVSGPMASDKVKFRKKSQRSVRRKLGGLRSTSSSRYGGRRTPMLSMVKAALPTRIMRFQGMTQQEAVNPATAPTSATSGYFPFPHLVSNTTTVADTPVYVLDLNATDNVSSVPQPYTFYRMQIDNMGKPVFQPVSGLSGSYSGTASMTSDFWIPEYANLYTSNQRPSVYISPSWYDCRFTFYGATQQHTKFFVEYVESTKMTSPIHSMNVVFSSSDDPIYTRIKDELAHYWQSKAKNLMSNQLAPSMPTGRRRVPMCYRTLKRWSYSTEPKQNTDVDATPNSVTAKLFIRDGRVLNYCWSVNSKYYDPTSTSVNAGRDDILPNPNTFETMTQSSNPALAVPYPTRQRYLIIRAVNTTSIARASETNLQTPSFDMCVRKKEICQFHTTGVTA